MLKSSLTVTVMTILGMMLSFVNQLQIAHLFGASIAMDQYLMAIGIPFLILGILNAVLSYSLVPALSLYYQHASQFSRTVRSFLWCFATVGGLIAALGWMGAEGLLRVWGNGAIIISKTMVAIAKVSWVNVAGALLLGFLTAVRNVRKEFVLPAIGAWAPYVGMIIFAAIWGRHLGPLALAYGTLVGYLAAAGLLLPGLGISITSVPRREDLSIVYSYSRIAFLALLSTLCFVIYPASDAYWAPKIGPSHLAHLGYVQRLLVALAGLVLAGPAAVLTPWLADAHNTGARQAFRNIVRRVLTLALLIGGPFATVLTVIRVPLIHLIFQRGAFGASDTLEVATLFPWMMAGMVAMVCSAIIFKALFAAHQTLSAAIIGGTGALMYFLLSGVFGHVFGVVGISGTYALVWWGVLAGTASALGGAVWRSKFAWQVLLKCIVVSAVVGLGTWIALAVFIPTTDMAGSRWGLLIRLGGVTCAAGVLYGVITIWILRVPEIVTLAQRIGRAILSRGLRVESVPVHDCR